MANTRIERVLRHDGIVAVLDWFTNPTRGHDPHWVGDDRWHPIVHEAVKLRQISGESSVRVLVGEHAVLVSGDENHVVGVVFIKGHPVVKSVVRMVRQLLRPVGSNTSASKTGAPKAPGSDNINKNPSRKPPAPNLPPQMNMPGPMGMHQRPMPGMARGPMGMPPAGPPMGMPPGMARAPMGMPPGMPPGNNPRPPHPGNSNLPPVSNNPNDPRGPRGNAPRRPAEHGPMGGAAANQGPNDPRTGGPLLIPPPARNHPQDDDGPKS